MTATRSASDRASSWSWVTSSAVAPLLAQHLDAPGSHLRSQARVERVERLVEQHELRRRRERTRERDALLLTAGQLVGAALGEMGKADEIQQLEHARRAHPAIGRARRRRLRQRPDAGTALPPAARSPRRVALGRRALPVGTDALAEGVRSRVGALEARDQPQQRRLAAARGPEHGGQAAARHLQVESIEHRRSAAERLAQAGDREAGRAHRPRRGATTAPRRRVSRYVGSAEMATIRPA